MRSDFFLKAGLVVLILGVMAGAFGAHALKAMLSEDQAQTWQTATEYLFYHALGLVGLALWSQQKSANRWTQLSGHALLAGIVLFSGSLYLMVLTGMRQLGMVTPFGGSLFILGWLFWLVSVFSQRSAD